MSAEAFTPHPILRGLVQPNQKERAEAVGVERVLLGARAMHRVLDVWEHNGHGGTPDDCYPCQAMTLVVLEAAEVIPQ